MGGLEIVAIGMPGLIHNRILVGLTGGLQVITKVFGVGSVGV